MPASRPAPEAPLTAASDEERLIEAARGRDEVAWSTIFSENFDALYRYAFYQTGDRTGSEEIAAQVFEEALRGIKKFQYRGVSLRAWLFRIARNLIADEFARKAKMRQTGLQETRSESDELAETATEHELLQALSVLPDDQQQVVSLTLLEDLPARDCAEVMGKTVREVHALQLKALRQLRAAVEEPERRVAS